MRLETLGNGTERVALFFGCCAGDVVITISSFP